MSRLVEFHPLLLGCMLALCMPVSHALADEKRQTKAEPAPQIRSTPAEIRKAPTNPMRAVPRTELRRPGEAPRTVRPPVHRAAWDYGCAEDHFPSSQRLARQIKLRMPIPANELPGVIPEPGVIHSDLDASKAGTLTQCNSWGAGHLCYNGHEGTDYSLGGAFLQMGTVRAVAAAPGKVIYTKENEFDGCHVTTDIGDLLDEDNNNNVVCPDPDNPEGNSINAANRVSVCHADGTVTEYLHLMRDSIPSNVTTGSTVQCGQRVGTIGSSGKSSGPHLHFSVLVPASRASLMGNANGQSKTIGGRSYVYLDPYHISVGKSLWTDQEWNYAGSFNNTVPLPGLEHPNGHTTTVACAHLVPPHDGHPGAHLTLYALHAHAGDHQRLHVAGTAVR